MSILVTNKVYRCFFVNTKIGECMGPYCERKRERFFIQCLQTFLILVF